MYTLHAIATTTSNQLLLQQPLHTSEILASPRHREPG